MKNIARNLFLITCLLVAFCPSSGRADELLPTYTLSVAFDLKEHLMKGNATIELKEDTDLSISLAPLKIRSITLNNQPLADIQSSTIEVHSRGVVEIEYEATFAAGNSSEHEDAALLMHNTISEQGITLSGKWYPSIEGTAFYRLRAIVPEGFTAISEADTISVEKTQNGREFVFDFPQPLQGLSLTAGRFTERKEISEGTDLYAYVFPEDIAIAKKCLENVKRSFLRYKEILPPYRYKRFSIVENSWAAGYSSPTVLVFNREALRSCSADDKSMDRDILFQWFGGRVYLDTARGDWAEGFISYLSDDMNEERKGTGWRLRKNLLAQYENYVNVSNEIPLREFRKNADPASMSIGRGKGAMLFHMLNNLVGKDAFHEAVKRFIAEKEFQRATWDDLRAAFESVSGKPLAWFFDQWLDRKGLPSIEIRDHRVTIVKGGPVVSFDVVQTGELYIFSVPVTIKTDRTEIAEQLKVGKKKEHFEIPVQGTPQEMIIDGRYDVLRTLTQEEYPSLLSELLGDDKKLAVLPESSEQDRYAGLIAVLQHNGFAVKEDDEVRDEDIRENALFVLGVDSPVLKRLFGKAPQAESGVTVHIRRNPLNTYKVIAVANGDSKNEIDSAAEHMLDYGEYSFLRFEHGKIVHAQVDETETGMRFRLREPVLVIQPQKTMKLEESIKNVLDKSIVYIGERHTNYEDHKVQLDVIMRLHEQGRKFAIGMEMFQRPFQQVLDDYLSGAISERVFLKRTEYFTRWQFDYNLYREIIEYARAEKIPIIALNQWSEIIKKVSNEGLDALTPAERAEVPESMDMSDQEYRERLEAVFAQHRNRESKSFDNFYQSQILWDETMAHSIDEFLQKNPGFQMVVLAGTGHIMYASGIPKRAFRLNGRKYATIIPWADSLDESIADYLFAADPMPASPTFKLGVVLKEKEGRVHIDAIIPGSIAKNAGLEKGDILRSLDEWPIEDVADVAIFMSDKKRGDTVTVKILRKGFLTGYREMTLSAVI